MVADPLTAVWQVASFMKLCVSNTSAVKVCYCLTFVEPSLLGPGGRKLLLRMMAMIVPLQIASGFVQEDRYMHNLMLSLHLGGRNRSSGLQELPMPLAHLMNRLCMLWEHCTSSSLLHLLSCLFPCFVIRHLSLHPLCCQVQAAVLSCCRLLQ